MSTALTPEIVSSQLPPQSAASLLNLRQKSFIDNLLECKVKWRAAQLAGYNGDMNTLAQTANDLLKLPKIRAYYDECLESLSLNPQRILAELGDIGGAPWREFVTVKVDDEGNTVEAQLRLQDKLKALELAGKYHRMFADKVETEVSLNDRDVDRIAQSFISALTQVASRRAAQVGPGDQQTIDITPGSDHLSE